MSRFNIEFVEPQRVSSNVNKNSLTTRDFLMKLISTDAVKEKKKLDVNGLSDFVISKEADSDQSRINAKLAGQSNWNELQSSISGPHRLKSIELGKVRHFGEISNVNYCVGLSPRIENQHVTFTLIHLEVLCFSN